MAPPPPPAGRALQGDPEWVAGANRSIRVFAAMADVWRETRYDAESHGRRTRLERAGQQNGFVTGETGQGCEPFRDGKSGREGQERQGLTSVGDAGDDDRLACSQDVRRQIENTDRDEKKVPLRVLDQLMAGSGPQL